MDEATLAGFRRTIVEAGDLPDPRLEIPCLTTPEDWMKKKLPKSLHKGVNENPGGPGVV